MKVLQINKYPSVKGGTEVVLFDTIKLLKEKGHDVILFSTNEGEMTFYPTYTIPYRTSEDSTIKKIYNLSSFFWNKVAIRQLEHIIIEENPDIAHVHLYLNGLSQSILPTLKKYHIPVVMTLHDYRQICPSYLLLDRNQNICEKCKNGNYLNCLLTRCSKGSLVESALLTIEMYYRRIFYKTEKYVDQFICVSNFQLEKYKQFNTDISSKSIFLYNPIKIPTKKPSVNRGKYLLFFGRLSKEKGLNSLISAMKNLPNIQLIVVGSGDQVFDNLPINVKFLGFKQKEELTELIQSAMYAIVPSEWYETFGLSCAESLSLGTPVIASNIGGIPEIIEDRKNGFLFEAKNVDELTNTIKKAINISDEEYISMAEYGYKSIEKFSQEKYISRLLDIYTSLLDKKHENSNSRN